MKINNAGIALIKQFEGCRLNAYVDPVGIWTIGYGLTTAAGLMEVKRGLKITQQQADDLLVKSLAKYEAAVSKALTRSPNENQFAAMVSLCFNIGPGAFAKSSVCRHFNFGDIRTAAASFALWNKGTVRKKRIVLPGLTRRRLAERELFFTPVVHVPAPLIVATAPVEPPSEPAPLPPEPEPLPSFSEPREADTRPWWKRLFGIA